MERLRDLASSWKADLLQNVLPFWLEHSIDSTHGGYFTCLDRDGALLDDTKYHWLQGRECWTFSRMHNDLDTEGAELREQWFAAAHNGARFLGKVARARRWQQYAGRADTPSTGNPRGGRASVRPPRPHCAIRHLMPRWGSFFSTTREGHGLHFQRRPWVLRHAHGRRLGLALMRARQVHCSVLHACLPGIQARARASRCRRAGHAGRASREVRRGCPGHVRAIFPVD